MAIIAYVLFPEDEIRIFDIIECQNKYDTFIKETVSFLSVVQKNGIRLYYDSVNIAKYIDTCILWDGAKNIKIGCDAIKVFLTKKSIDINTNPLKERDCKYVLWNYDKCPTVNDNPHNLLVEITEHKYRYTGDECILIDINDSIESCRRTLVTFKDSKHIKEHPAPFIHIPHLFNKGELELWLKTNHIKEFSLFDKSRFQRTGRTYHAKPIFQEIDSQYYWYLDNLHKDEYEVFNANCEHIGTATLQGEMNPNSQVNGRRIIL